MECLSQDPIVTERRLKSRVIYSFAAQYYFYYGSDYDMSGRWVPKTRSAILAEEGHLTTTSFVPHSSNMGMVFANWQSCFLNNTIHVNVLYRLLHTDIQGDLPSECFQQRGIPMGRQSHFSCNKKSQGGRAPGTVKPRLLRQLSGILLALQLPTVSLSSGYLPLKVHERENLSPNSGIQPFPAAWFVWKIIWTLSFSVAEVP